jgi:hypothetical protein
VRSELDRVTADLLSAYDRLIAANSVNNWAEFRAYCERYSLDYEGMMQAARLRVTESIDRYKLERKR